MFLYSCVPADVCGTLFIIIIDGCRSNQTLIPSHSGNENLTITVNWDETNIGDTAKSICPCGDLTAFGAGALFATRYCGGDFNNGGRWSTPDISQCNFTDLSRDICLLLNVSGNHAV